MRSAGCRGCGRDREPDRTNTMTATMATASASNSSAPSDEVALVDERIEQLLATHDPATTPRETIWGAQYDLGLAWVSSPVGLGGLDVPPLLQERVNTRLAAAGVTSNYLHNFVGVGTAAP